MTMDMLMETARGEEEYDSNQSSFPVCRRSVHSLDGVAFGRLGSRCHTIICRGAKEGGWWLGYMRGDGVAEVLLELQEVPRSVLGRIWGTRSGLEDGVVVVVVVER
jgi:hypothetical protein